ncbi:sodium:proton antiporter [Pseudoruegeria sp. SK021]|uniref:cation:proton antiporter n=1 Tax=Pseudoruegeria sp. SK021 TaxID=1933035 RepID=UPI000A21CC7F|nr:cation:proton antiporter [Pseudoruegeria sp. SK021]OSP54930.1 sodium:potassium antiporter [Pseudoruegeria sp. SK021]
MTGFFILCLITALYSLFAERLSSSMLTAPMVFLALGAGLSVSGLLPLGDIEHLLDPVAELALVVLLFLDAAKLDVAALRNSHAWPVRMLLLGLPLAILLGCVTAAVLFPDWPWVVAALAAAILAPTDAALGQAVVSNPDMPARPKRALIVESGLNDGLALPAILLFASLTAEVSDQTGRDWALFAAMQLVLGPLAGIIVGALGSRALLWARDRGMTTDTYEGIATLTFAGGSYLLAELIGGNGFIAAFVAGMSFGSVIKGRIRFVYDFTDSEGQLLAWAAFFLMGAALIPEALMALTWPMLGLILASLFCLRPLAIWLSLLGTDAAPVTRLFFGWFGPRGLATALFALVVVEQIDHVYGDVILHLAVNTVWISALLHGASAAFGARWYGERVARMAPCAESAEVTHRAVPRPHPRHRQ